MAHGKGRLSGSDSPLAPPPCPPIKGSCERREAPLLPPPVATALHRGPPRHCTPTTNSMCTNKFIHYFLILVILSVLTSLSLSVNFKNPCFIYIVKGNNPPIYTKTDLWF
jgi:hypothetical protein